MRSKFNGSNNEEVLSDIEGVITNLNEIKRLKEYLHDYHYSDIGTIYFKTKWILDRLVSNYNLTQGENFYLEISGRATGKTTRLLKTALEFILNDRRVCLVYNSNRHIKQHRSTIIDLYANPFNLELQKRFEHQAPKPELIGTLKYTVNQLQGLINKFIERLDSHFIQTTYNKLDVDTRGRIVDLFLFDDFDYSNLNAGEIYKLLTPHNKVKGNPILNQYYTTTPKKSYTVLELFKLNNYNKEFLNVNMHEVSIMEYLLICNYLNKDTPPPTSQMYVGKFAEHSLGSKTDDGKRVNILRCLN